jgi:hypothetical protein
MASIWQCKIEWFHFGCVGVKEQPRESGIAETALDSRKRSEKANDFFIVTRVRR